jgi:L-cysteine:1D-myo-inositol 2-amino-2-deoxy-alpha-D-glucopyranoside ligase
MQLYNTLTREKEAFVIPRDRAVTLYVCGVTPYDTTHIGHARTFLTFDVLVRYLRWKGAEVRYCQNVTDVDDPLFARARRDGIGWQELAEQQVEQLIEDYRGLNIALPTYFPRASEEIGAMIPIIERLVELGHAYVVDSEVYFSVATDPEFGQMAQMGYDELLAIANQRGNKPDDPNKRDPLDFVLWQRGEPDDPTWESPWGPGRPGWHIECSAMATKYLGEQLDIHGGGADLIFPHHPSEIAQTEPVTGKKPFVRTWMHAGLVSLDGVKMSKSLGNLVFARDALSQHHPDALRWYLLSGHYRDEFDYSRAAVFEYETLALELRQAVEAASGGASSLDLSSGIAAFEAAMADDLNTPAALAALRAMCVATLAASAEGRDVGSATAALRDLAAGVGFTLLPR